ncbi:MAG: NERD domain-containing protein [Alkalibacterium sp.]|nr:NERD domain-containing protein [Alkalibacterium sp.]
MEIIKERTMSNLHLGLQYLDKRMKLPIEDRNRLRNMEKGFQGEELFDSIVKQHLKGEAMMLNDLLLNVNGNTFQIDSLIITPTKVHLFEIKNFSGNFTNVEGQFNTQHGKVVNHPSIQLKKTRTLLNKLFQEWENDMHIEANVVFVNPTFFLYQAKKTDPFIFYSQLEYYLGTVGTHKLFLNKQHTYLAEQLIQAQRFEAPYQKELPLYTFDNLDKGLSCPTCFNLTVTRNQRTAECRTCRKREPLHDVLRFNIRQHLYLFDQFPLTSSIISDWVGGSVDKRVIARLLKKDYKRTGHSKGTLYLSDKK